MAHVVCGVLFIQESLSHLFLSRLLVTCEWYNWEKDTGVLLAF